MKTIQIKTMLFLCTGNYYRSRFAEILFNSIATKMGLAWQASSRALALERGVLNVGPIAKATAQAATRLGIRADAAFTRFPAQVSAEELAQADRVIALQLSEHSPLVLERYPDWQQKIEYWDVADDPLALPLIEKEVNRLIACILGGGQPEPELPPEPRVDPKAKPKKPIVAKVGRETAGRRGKGVTTIFGLPLSEAELHELATQLKQRCGTGGTVKDGRIEIQGDQRERIISELEKLGYQVKRVGG